MANPNTTHTGICTVEDTLDMLIEAGVFVHSTKAFSLSRSEVENALLVSRFGVGANLGLVFKGLTLEREAVRRLEHGSFWLYAIPLSWVSSRECLVGEDLPDFYHHAGP